MGRSDEQSSQTLQFWLGDCCEWCTPNAARLRFEGVTSLLGLNDDTDLGEPLFRLASAHEIQANSLAVPPECRAFCVVTSHGQGQDGPSVFIVAHTAELVQPPPRS